MTLAVPCSHAQQYHRGPPVEWRGLSFASEAFPQHLHHGGLESAAAAKELLHLAWTRVTG